MFASWKKSENAASTRALLATSSRATVVLELRVVAARTGVAGQRTDPLLEGEEALALLLDEHAPEQVAEEVDVGTEPLVGGGLNGHASVLRAQRRERRE